MADMINKQWTVGLLIVTGLVLMSSCNECKGVGEEWCDGNILKECYVGIVSGLGNTIGETDCTEIGAECKELEWDDGYSDATCVLTPEPCQGGLISVCVGDIIAPCIYTGFPSCSDLHGYYDDVNDDCEDCAQDGKICRHISGALSAQCVFPDDSCTLGEKRCSEEGDNWYECNEGFFLKYNECREGTSCVENGDGGVDCE